MSQQTIGIGSVANDGTGDPIRVAFDKVNQNFTEVYSAIGTPTQHGVVLGAAAGALAYLAVAAAGTVLGGVASSDPAFTATPVLGVAGTTLGSIGLSGNSSGVVTIKPQAAAGTYNFNLPITAGNAGDILTSGGGGSSPMTWSTPTAINALTDTWNNSGTTYTGIGLTISGTSQAATSRMLRFTYNSQDQFAVDYDGGVYVYASASGVFNMYLRGNKIAAWQYFGASYLGGDGNTDNAGIKFQRFNSSQTSNQSVGTTQLSGTCWDNAGASGEVDFTLPATGSTKKGQWHTFTVVAAQTLKIIAPASVAIAWDTGSGTISTTSTGGNISCAAPGSSITLRAVSATLWVADAVTGTWA